MNKSTRRKIWSVARVASTRNARRHARASRRGGFTLVEILVVLVIASLLMAIVVSGFSSVSANNRRISCQTNMTQIYAALRLYSADADGKFPYYGGKDSVTQTQGSGDKGGRGIGLWALYTFHGPIATPTPTPPVLPPGYDYLGAAIDDDNTRNVKPVEVYLRKVGALHCPADDADDHISLFGTVTGDVTAYNEDYLSYQVIDSDFGNTLTYKTTRVTGTPGTPPEYNKRQLLTYAGTDPDDKPLPRTPPTNTVVTWCKWHRGSNGRDIVLFYDGSVQSIDQTQDDPDGGATPLETWQRKPKPVQ